MVMSMNTKVVYTTKANCLTGSIGNKHGDVMVGDKAFEFYNHRNPEDYIQIPWTEIDKVRAQMFFRDKYIRGFFIDTKSAGSFVCQSALTKFLENFFVLEVPSTSNVSENTTSIGEEDNSLLDVLTQIYPKVRYSHEKKKLFCNGVIKYITY